MMPVMRNATAGLLAAFLLAGTAQAQAQAAGATQPVPRETLSNIQTGIYPMRYVGDASKSVTRIVRDTIMTRNILTAGDPMGAGANGAVLRYRKDVVVGSMQPGEATALEGMADQQVVYVEGGTGTLDDGVKGWPLHEGLVLLLPANVKNRFTATGDKPLKMLMMTEPAHTDEKASKTILVRDVSKILYIEQGAHWNNMSKAPFNDVGERFLIVYLGPRSIAGPHAHTPETEEGWIKLSDGATWLQMGSEILPWTKNMGMIAPPNGLSVHAAINTSDSTQAFFYFATTRAPGSPPPPPNPNRVPPNPIFDESSVKSAVAPVLLKNLK